MQTNPNFQSGADMTVLLPLDGGAMIVSGMPHIDEVRRQRAFGDAPHLVRSLAPTPVYEADAADLTPPSPDNDYTPPAPRFGGN